MSTQSVDRETLATELTRFFVLCAFDASRTAAIHRVREGREDVEDRRVLRDRLDAFIRNGAAGHRTRARVLTQRISALECPA